MLSRGVKGTDGKSAAEEVGRIGGELLDAESGVKGTDGKSAADVAGKMAILLYHVTSSPMVLHVLFY